MVQNLPFHFVIVFSTSWVSSPFPQNLDIINLIFNELIVRYKVLERCVKVI